MRVGIGYDIHRLERGRELVLGGVRIPFEKGLLGHSDGDVLCHAVMDSLLGASGLPDIGFWFPPEDSKFKGAYSLKLLQEVGSKIQSAGWRIVNIDTVLVAEKPRLQEFIPSIREKITSALNLDVDSFNIKATTNEGVGALGKGEAISCYAVSLLIIEKS
ncbi:MAG: 2-C-methyl-D-erythritol 2,4-cyclodiphosphate synthase [Candidatus Atribacteria bacterium]|nr:2-C-methyl-D-erythritol 2,4-cyclodiphosphate synthase [Candidatus Atribacteria bacterium]MCD6349377.1 2-C-methyl-D-erythritol 2,4-cyclodiphosphate synthase [Candidatus Atribacteria bacterium]